MAQEQMVALGLFPWREGAEGAEQSSEMASPLPTCLMVSSTTTCCAWAAVFDILFLIISFVKGLIIVAPFGYTSFKKQGQPTLFIPERCLFAIIRGGKCSRM
jgi:hypothetical protein